MNGEAVQCVLGGYPRPLKSNQKHGKPANRFGSGTAYWMGLDSLKRLSSSVGSCFHWKSKQWTHLVIKPHDIFKQIQKIAKDRNASSVTLNPDTRHWSLISTHPESDHFDLLVDIDEKIGAASTPPKHIPRRLWHQGRRFFFVVPVYPWGIGKVKQLPFTIQFWNRKQTQLDAPTKTLYMPRCYRPGPDMFGFYVGKRGLLVHFSGFTVFEPRVQQQQGHSFQQEVGFSTYLFFPSSGADPVFIKEKISSTRHFAKTKVSATCSPIKAGSSFSVVYDRN